MAPSVCWIFSTTVPEVLLGNGGKVGGSGLASQDGGLKVARVPEPAFALDLT